MTDKEEIGLEDRTEHAVEEGRETAAEGGGSDRSREEQELRQSLGSSAPTKKGRASRRTLLLLLLLVVLGVAAGYNFLGISQPEPQSPIPAVVKKQAIAVPPKPEPKVVPAEPAAPQPAPAPEKVVEKEMPAGEKVVEKKVAVQAPAAAASAEEDKVVESPPVSAEKDPSAVVPAGPYVVQAGAFLLKSNLETAEKQIRQLGFEPRVSHGEKVVPMTRLRVAVLPAAEAKKKMREIADMAPDAFLLKSGNELALYAGSYYDLDQARMYADQLYEKGLRVIEEPAEVAVPLYLLSFGEFADLNAARQEAGRARQIDLEAYVDRI